MPVMARGGSRVHAPRTKQQNIRWGKKEENEQHNMVDACFLVVVKRKKSTKTCLVGQQKQSQAIDLTYLAVAHLDSQQ